MIAKLAGSMTGILIALAVCSVASACPTCKDAMCDQTTAQAFAISILFMMSMPFLIFGGWMLAIWRMQARQSKLMPVSNRPVIAEQV